MSIDPSYDVFPSVDDKQPPRRKIIQIAAMPGQRGSWHPATIALCSDGTIWRMSDFAQVWEKLPTIPQPGDK